MKAQLLQQIKRHEGLRLHAYEDHLGYLTIGYGRLIDQRKGGGITEDEAEQLLQNDLSQCQDDLLTIDTFRDLDPIRQAALINMRFQLGGSGIREFRKMWAALDRQDWHDARAEALNSRWAKQTPGRAKEIANILLTGEWQ